MQELEPQQKILKSQDVYPVLHEWSVKSAIACGAIITIGLATAIISDNESAKFVGLFTSLCATIMGSLPTGVLALEKLNDFALKDVPLEQPL